MAVREPDPSDRAAYLDRMSKGLTGKRAELDVDSLRLGHQSESERIPIPGTSYDPKDAVAASALDGLDHVVHRARAVTHSPPPR